MDFDRIRLATSVTNRILNTYDAIHQRKALPAPPAMGTGGPLPPEPTMAGASLEMRLEQPVTGAATPEGDAAGEAALLRGAPDTALDGLLAGPSLESQANEERD